MKHFFFLALIFLNTGFGQVPYYGPDESPHVTQPSPKVSQKIRVQILVYDQPDLGGLTIQEVSFNGTTLALQPADLNGFRGGGSFALSPGSYSLNWIVSRDARVWPRTIKHRQTVQITSKDSWMQVTIQGDQVTVL